MSWETEVPFFQRVMPRDHFELLFWLLHVSHSQSDQEKRIDKVGLLLESMLTRLRRRYYPGSELAVDETMVGFRGRFATKQYMPNKPMKCCGYHMFTDRYYTSLPLAQTLHSLQTGFTGTCMKNRTDLPDDVRGQLRLQHGQVAAYRADHLLTLVISPLVSLIVDQVCSLQARGICAAILSGNREQSAAGYREGHRTKQD